MQSSVETPQTPKMAFSQEVALEVDEDSLGSDDTSDEGEIRKNVAEIWRPGWTVVLGGFLLHLTVGSLDCGNISLYLSSFFRARVEEGYEFEEATWIHSERVMAQGVTMVLGGFLVNRMGPRNAAFLGCAVATSGVLLTGLTVSLSPSLVVFTYGILYGVGTGIAYVVPLACGLKWYPHNPGLVTGVILAGYGIGSAMFSHLQIFVMNPNNLTVDSESKYFEDEQMLNRVPKLFFVLGGAYAVLQAAGCTMLADPASPDFTIQEKEVPESSEPGFKQMPNPVRKLTRGLSDLLAKAILKKDAQEHFPASPAAETIKPLKISHQQAIFVIGDNFPDEPLFTYRDSIQEECKVPSKRSAEKSIGEIIARNMGTSSPYPLLDCAKKMHSELPPGLACRRSSSTDTFDTEIFDEDLDLSPREAVQTGELCMLWITCLLSQQVVVCSHMLERLVNESLASNTHSFQRSVIGPATCFLNAMGTIVWGALSDRFNYKKTMLAAMGILTVFLACFWAVDRLGSHALFAVWSIIVFSSTRSSVSIFPSAICKAFGTKHFGVNYGLVQTSTVVSQALHNLVVEVVQLYFGPVGVICTTAICTTVAFLITWFYDDDSNPLTIRQRLARSGSIGDPDHCFTV